MPKRITQSALIIAEKTNIELCEHYAATKRLMAHIEKELVNRCKDSGPIAEAGIYVDQRQSVSEPLPTVSATLVALESMHGMFPGMDIKGIVLKAALEKIPARSWKNFSFGIPEQELFRKRLDEQEDGGMQICYGSARLAVRTTPPDAVKSHIILPGEQPLTNTIYIAAFENEDEESEGEVLYDDFDSLSPGD